MSESWVRDACSDVTYRRATMNEQEYEEEAINGLVTVRGVTKEGLNGFNPDCYDARKEEDGTYTLIPLMWW